MNIGRLIKALRINFGISQSELSGKLKITSNYLCLVETGKRNPSNELILRVAQEFKISKDALEFLCTDIPSELDNSNSKKYKKLQERIAALLLFKASSNDS